MFKNVASQKLIVFAFDSTTNLPKTGDAANLTAYVSKDYGAATVLGDTSATEIDSTNAKGYYLFDLTQAETNADTLLFTAKSSTANIVVVGSPATVYTVPPNFTATSIDSNGRVDVIKVAGTTQTAKDIGGAVPAAAAGASGGLLISGGNSGTTTFGALTCTGAFTVSGGLVATNSTLNGAAFSLTGNGSGAGLKLVGGATGNAMQLTGGSGISALSVLAAGGANAVSLQGEGAGVGLSITGGSTGAGLTLIGGSTSGVGLSITTTSGDGISVTPTAGNALALTANGTSKHGAVITGGTAGTSDGVKAVAGTGGVPIRGDITGNITGTITTVTTATNVTTVNGLAAGVITASSIAADAITAAKIADGAIDAATFAAGAIDAAAIATDAASEIAAAVWDLSTTGHTTSGTFGAAVVAAGSAGDPWATSLPGAYGAGTAGKIIGDNINATISSRMATFTLPTNFSALVISAGGIVSADAVAISGDSTAADNLETMLDGTGGQTLSLGALTVSGNTTFTGTTTHTGAVSYAAGIAITQSTTNAAALSLTGNGTGAGISATGGATGAGISGTGGASGANGISGTGTSGGSGIRAAGGATGHGVNATGGATSGNGIIATGGPAGTGISAVGGTTSGTGLSATGTGSGAGFNVAGGTTGNGLRVIGGGTSGNGIRVTVTSGNLIDMAGVEFDAYARTALGLASANLDTQLGTIDDFLDTEIAAIKAKTDNLPSVAMLCDTDGRLIVDAHKVKFTISGATQSVYAVDGATVNYTKTLTTDAAALPITGNS